MTASSGQGWERWNDRLLGWCAYILLAIPTVLLVLGATRDPAGRPITLAIAALAAAWIYLFFTRLPMPQQAHRLRMYGYFVGLLVLASILMVREPLFFIFMISGFFYATMLRPLPLAVVGVFATSVLVNSLIAGLPQSPEAWTFYVAIIAVQTAAIGAGAVIGEKMT